MVRRSRSRIAERGTSTRFSKRCASSATRAYIPGRMRPPGLGTITVTRAVRVPPSTTGLMVCTVPVKGAGKAAKLTRALRPGERKPTSPSSTCTSTLIGSSATIVISSSPARTHCPGTTFIDATRPANGAPMRVRDRSSCALRRRTSAPSTPVLERAKAARSARTRGSWISSSRIVASRYAACACRSAACASSTASPYSAASIPARSCPAATASFSCSGSAATRPATWATTTVFFHPSACPAALTDTTSASRIAGTPFTGIATSVAKLPLAEVRGRGPPDASSPSPSPPCEARMRP
jgi:hypothetical protein